MLLNKKEYGGGQSDPTKNSLSRILKEFWYFRIYGMFLLLTIFIKDMFVQPPHIDYKNLEKSTNQIVVMTGGTRGIGLAVVKKLLKLDYTIVLGVRKVSTGEEAVDGLRKLGTTSGKVKFFPLDLKSLDSVRRFAFQVLSSCKRIDLIINNAGIMNVPFEETVDKYESHFQVNYLSHFLLTNLLLPRMKTTSEGKSTPCYIVHTSSYAQKGGDLDFNELERSKVYSGIKCYLDSKLCQVVHVRRLAKKLAQEGANISAYSVHPGEIPTDLWLQLGVIGRMSLRFVKYFCRSAEGAADIILYPALVPSLIRNPGGGEYFESGIVTMPNEQADDVKIQNRLWERSSELCNVSCEI